MSEQVPSTEDLQAAAGRVLAAEPSVMENEGVVAPEPAQESDREGHPDLVLDPAKAAVMVHATKRVEEGVVGYRDSALKLASSGQFPEAEREAHKAEETRKRADSDANRAGAVYDTVKDL